MAMRSQGISVSRASQDLLAEGIVHRVAGRGMAINHCNPARYPYRVQLRASQR
jgi:hypothetical protein